MSLDPSLKFREKGKQRSLDWRGDARGGFLGRPRKVNGRHASRQPSRGWVERPDRKPVPGGRTPTGLPADQYPKRRLDEEGFMLYPISKISKTEELCRISM